MESIAASLVFALIGVFAIITGIKQNKLKKKYSGWAITKAFVKSKEVGLKKIASGDDRSNFRVYVSYQYTVNSSEYSGNNLYDLELIGGEISMLEKMAVKKMNKIPDTINIHYNPENPAESFVYGTSKGIGIFLIIFGPIFILIGLLFGLMFFIP
jgi:hypothetical protein